MRLTRVAIAAALSGAVATAAALAQQPASSHVQPIRLRGVIDKVDGRVVSAKSANAEPVTLKLADKALVVAVVNASAADIKPGLFIGSGAMPQPGGQRAVEARVVRRRHED